MKNKRRFVIAIFAICIALASFVVGLVLSQFQTYNIQGSFSYISNNSYINLETKIYKYTKNVITKQEAAQILKDKSSLVEITELAHSFYSYDENKNLKQEKITNKLFEHYDFDFKDSYAFFIVTKVWSIQTKGVVRAKITNNLKISNTWSFEPEDIAIPVNKTGVEIVLGFGKEDSNKISKGLFDYKIDFSAVEQFTPKQTGVIQAQILDHSTTNFIVSEKTFNQYTEIATQTTTLSMQTNIEQMEVYNMENLDYYTAFVSLKVGGFMIDNRHDISLKNIQFFDDKNTSLDKTETRYVLVDNQEISKVSQYQSILQTNENLLRTISYQPQKTFFELRVSEQKNLSFGIFIPKITDENISQVCKISFDLEVVSEELPVQKINSQYRLETDASGNVYVWPTVDNATYDDTFYLENNYFDLNPMQSKVAYITFPLNEEFVYEYLYNSSTVKIPGDVPAEAQGNPIVWLHFFMVYTLWKQYGYLPIPKKTITLTAPGFGVRTFKPENWLSDIYYVMEMVASTPQAEQIRYKEYVIPDPTGDTLTIPVNLYRVENFDLQQIYNSSYNLEEHAGTFTVHQKVWEMYARYNYHAKRGTILPWNYGLPDNATYYDFLVGYLTGNITSVPEVSPDERIFTTLEYIPIVPGTKYQFAESVSWNALCNDYKTVYFNRKTLTEIHNINTIAYDSDLRKFDVQDGVLYTQNLLFRYPNLKALTQYTIKENTVEIYDYAFANAQNLATLTIPKSVVKFGKNIFQNSSVGTLNIYSENLSDNNSNLIQSINNSNITVVNVYANRYMSDQEIANLKTSCNCEINILFKDNISELIFEIKENGAFVVGIQDTSLDYVVVPDIAVVGKEVYNVVGINNNVFENCQNMLGIKLPDTLTHIGDNNFKLCTKLTRLNLENNVLEYFGTNNIHENIEIWTKKEITYSKIKEANPKAIGIDWSLVLDGGDATYSYNLIIGQKTYTISGDATNINMSQKNTYLLVFPSLLDNLNVGLTTSIVAKSQNQYSVDSIFENVKLQQKQGELYETLFESATPSNGFVEYKGFEVNSSYPKNQEIACVSTGDELKVSIHYAIVQKIQGFTQNTNVMLANGTSKNIKDINYDDLLLVYNFDFGGFSASYPVIISNPIKYDYFYKIEFEDNSVLEVALQYDLFCASSMQYINVIDNNYFSIGQKFLKQTITNGNNVLEYVTCTNITRINEPCNIYNLTTSQTLNIIANGFVSANGMNNIYSIEKTEEQNLIYNQSQLEYIKSGTQNNVSGTMFAYYRFDISVIPYYIYESFRLAEIKNIAINLSNNEYPLYLAEKDVINRTNNYFTDGYLKNLKQNQISLKGSFSDREHYRRYEIGDVCEMPTPNNITNFIGWYSTFDGKIYQPQEFAPMHISTHFIAMYSK